MANDDYSKETIVEVSTTTSVEVMAERLAYFMAIVESMKCTEKRCDRCMLAIYQ